MPKLFGFSIICECLTLGFFPMTMLIEDLQNPILVYGGGKLFVFAYLIFLSLMLVLFLSAGVHILVTGYKISDKRISY